MTSIAFISGHTDLSASEFKEHYIESLNNVIKYKHHVVVGNADGADSFTLQYLISNGHDPSVITVYLFHRTANIEELVNHYKHVYNVSAITGWTSYNKRDTAMTIASTYDLCWVRSEEECRILYGNRYKKRISGTEQNVIRRLKMLKK